MRLNYRFVLTDEPRNLLLNRFHVCSGRIVPCRARQVPLVVVLDLLRTTSTLILKFISFQTFSGVLRKELRTVQGLEKVEENCVAHQKSLLLISGRDAEWTSLLLLLVHVSIHQTLLSDHLRVNVSRLNWNESHICRSGINISNYRMKHVTNLLPPQAEFLVSYVTK